MQEIRKILFLAEGQLGDSIVLTPALRAVKKTYPGVHTSVLLFHRRKYINNRASVTPAIENSNFEGTAEVFKGNADVDSVLELDRSIIRGLKGFARLRAERNCISYLRKQKYDAVICTFPQNRFVIWSFLAGIKIRIGEKGQQFGSLLTDKPEIKRSDAGVLNYFCDLLRPLGISAQDKTTLFIIPKDAVEYARNVFDSLNIESRKKLLLIHPGASDKDRQLPPEKMAEIISKLKNEGKFEILVTYSEYDREYISKLNIFLDKKINCVMTVKISELAGILKLADAALVHNSGPRHLAAAIGIKTIGLLEKYDDIMWKIYDDENRNAVIQSKTDCAYCKGGKCLGIIPAGEIYGAACMRDIETSDVLSSIERVINNP